LSSSAKKILSQKYSDYNTIGDYIINLGNDVYVSVNYDKNSNYKIDYNDNNFSLYENDIKILDSIEIHIFHKIIYNIGVM
jgi:exopolysaccharide biosynthesis predicted pyruvyltransferase EpsI